MEKSKLFNRLNKIAGIRNSNRGLSVIHSKILDRIERYELSQFEKQCPKIDFKSIPVKEAGEIVAWL